MGETIPVIKTSKARHVGIFEGSKWYRTMWDNIELMGYKIHETAYKEKTTAHGKEVIFWWECKKHPRDDSYVQFKIVMQVVIVGLKDIKIQKDGKEVKMDHADNEMRFNADIVTDPDKRWSSGFSKYLRWLYDKFFYRSKLEFYKTRLYEEVYTIQNEAKAYFNLVKFM